MGAALDISQTLHSGEGLVTLAVGPICIAIWRTEVTRVTFAKQKAALASVVKAHPGEAVFICIVEPTCRPPDEELRKASSQMINSHGRDLKCVACVVEGTGFRAAITRTVLSGIVLFIRSPAPLKYFDTAENAANWVKQYAKGLPIPLLLRRVEEARALLAPAENR